MDSDVAAGLAGLSVFAFLFTMLLAILWILVPFAIFGIKPLLKQLIAEQRATNKLLQLQTAQVQAPKHPPTQSAPLPPPQPPPDDRTIGEMTASRKGSEDA